MACGHPGSHSMQISLRRQSGASQLTCAKKERKNEMWLASETGTSVWEPSWLDSNDRERACLEGSLFSDRVSVPNTEPGVRLHELTLGHSLVFLKRPAGKVTHTIETVISCSLSSQPCTGAFVWALSMFMSHQQGLLQCQLTSFAFHQSPGW